SIFHEGIDLKAAIGTKVYSAADGIVETTKYNGGYGNMLTIQHAYGFKSVYGHLSRFAVQPGQFVRKGQLIAFSGNTGLTAGPHLHYEVRFIGDPLNPDPFLKWNYSNFAYLFEKEKKVRWASLVEATRWQAQAERLSYRQEQKSSVN
ncbi:MAG TPA: M23 family metallopeptidase, partial [Campylobacterales bacterium]|nr:M23 family metallopeptidase [Campylobacterales bacterium]